MNLTGHTHCVQYLNDVLLARLVLGGPLHRPPSQIDSELRLRLVAAKLLEQRKQLENSCIKMMQQEYTNYLFLLTD